MHFSPNVSQRNGYSRQYKPVTAYTVDRPVYVNQTNINTFPYQALNYKPEGVQYPYVYVPIAQFSRVGAKVTWDDQTQTLSVTSDYYKILNELRECQESLKGCLTSIKTQMTEHPPTNPMKKITQKQLNDIISPYMIRPEMGYAIWSEVEEDETKFGAIHIEHMQPGSIQHPPGAALGYNQELQDKLTEAYGYPVRIIIGGRHFTRLGVFKY